MIIMIIFLVLSVVLIILTAFYLNNKKKNISKNIKQPQNKDTEPKKNTHSNKKLADMLEIKVIDNMICLGNRYSFVLRLGNIDYNMLSNSEQDAVENILIQTSLAIDYPIEFFSTTEYINTSKIITLLKQNKTNNPAIKEYQHHLINYMQVLMENRNISVVKNYAILSYDGLYENAIDELTRKANSFKANMLRAKIICEVLNEDEIYDLIYRELNKNSALTIHPLKEGGKNLYVGKKQENKRNRHIQKHT